MSKSRRDNNIQLRISFGFAIGFQPSKISLEFFKQLAKERHGNMFPESRTMNTFGKISPRVARRISAAEGYLDLDLPERALRELETITEPGPYEPTVEYMKGEALIAQRRFSEAIAPLKRAVQLIPPPHNREAWKSLGECYRLRGDEELADMIELFSEQDNPPEAVPNILQILNITLMLEQAIDDHEADDLDWGEHDLLDD